MAANGGWGYSLVIYAPSVGPHWVAQLGGVLGVALAVDHHQGSPLVVIDDLGNAAEMLKDKKKFHQTSKYDLWLCFYKDFY